MTTARPQKLVARPFGQSDSVVDLPIHQNPHAHAHSFSPRGFVTTRATGFSASEPAAFQSSSLASAGCSSGTTTTEEAPTASTCDTKTPAHVEFVPQLSSSTGVPLTSGALEQEQLAIETSLEPK